MAVNIKSYEYANFIKRTEHYPLASCDKSEDGLTRRLTIYTEPVAKGRPRFTKNGHAYTPKKTAEYEQMIADLWGLYHKGIFTGTLKVKLDFYMPIPKSMTKAEKQAAIDKVARPAKKPDIDNLIKAVLDGLNEVAFWDDKQIVKLTAEKWYATEPRVEMTIMELRE